MRQWMGLTMTGPAISPSKPLSMRNSPKPVARLETPNTMPTSYDGQLMPYGLRLCDQ